MNRYDIMFWVCVFGAALNILLANISIFVPLISENAGTFLFSASAFTIGAWFYYINCEMKGGA